MILFTGGFSIDLWRADDDRMERSGRRADRCGTGPLPGLGSCIGPSPLTAPAQDLVSSHAIMSGRCA
eukprot:6184192-Pleurochrysis_carterae.AAC.2